MLRVNSLSCSRKMAVLYFCQICRLLRPASTCDNGAWHHRVALRFPLWVQRRWEVTVRAGVHRLVIEMILSSYVCDAV